VTTHTSATFKRGTQMRLEHADSLCGRERRVDHDKFSRLSEIGVEMIEEAFCDDDELRRDTVVAAGAARVLTSTPRLSNDSNAIHAAPYRVWSRWRYR
jgi:hypothetical protein